MSSKEQIFRGVQQQRDAAKKTEKIEYR